jgi:uncharacterized protein YkwD
MRRALTLAAAAIAAVALAQQAQALDLNGFRREHHLPPLHVSAAMAGAAYEHAHDLAAREHLDHDGFYQRMGALSSTAAENVAYGCASETCVIRMWAHSPGHRRNMLMRGVTHYGLASARGANGQTYWVLELGN